jgi:CRISPR-associated protein (TIGR02710 family)
MYKILIITVGSSPEPIITSIKTLEPDRVVFICSDDGKGIAGTKTQIIGSGKPCKFREGIEITDLPNIPTYLELGDRFQSSRDLVLLKDPDDLSEGYSKVVAKILEIRQENPNSQIMADYTGGTKTMSSILVLAAIDYQRSHSIQLYVTTALRTNLIKVQSGELTERAAITSVVVERSLNQNLGLFIQQFNYPAAISELKALLRAELSPNLKQRVRDLHAYCIGFDAWDRFDHTAAWRSLSPFTSQKDLLPSLLFLKRVMASREVFSESMQDSYEAPESMNGHGYEIVEDLLLNAERRATLERFDDAVARLYRALEMLTQVRLWLKYELKTSNIDINATKFPEALRADFSTHYSKSTSKKIVLSLSNGYKFLSRIPDDPIGHLYKLKEQVITDRLSIRNQSILAHGLRPVTKEDYDRFKNEFVPLIQDCIRAVTVPNKQLEPLQFPRALNP